MKYDGWCLASPQGRIVSTTFALTRDECWVKSYAYLYDRLPGMQQLWKKWEESQDLATKKGWCMRRVRLVLAEGGR